MFKLRCNIFSVIRIAENISLSLSLSLSLSSLSFKHLSAKNYKTDHIWYSYGVFQVDANMSDTAPVLPFE